MLKLAFQIILLPLPWPFRRLLLRRLLNADISPSARIGRSIILNVGALTMADHSRIGDFNIIRNLDRLVLGSKASIGTFNWIAGNVTRRPSEHFKSFPDRRSELLLGDHSAIVARHIIDCTDSVSIGRFSTIAGHRTQILTHAIDIAENMQSCEPVKIGDYCFVGTAAVVLKGAVLPSYSVLGAGGVLISGYDKEWTVYAGNPAREVKTLDRTYKYFVRTSGFVT